LLLLYDTNTLPLTPSRVVGETADIAIGLKERHVL
jgi:hypothetical protein